MKTVILTPNPYRDKGFQTVRAAMKVLKDAGVECKVCLPFEVDRSFELPRDLRITRLDKELPHAEMVVCFGGDGTILHMAKTATRHNIPVLGVNIGTMGFMAELESSELDQLARLAKDDYTLDSRMMLDVTIHRDRDIVFHDICLNDAVITKGAIARIAHLSVKCDGVPAMPKSLSLSSLSHPLYLRPTPLPLTPCGQPSSTLPPPAQPLSGHHLRPGTPPAAPLLLPPPLAREQPPPSPLGL